MTEIKREMSLFQQRQDDMYGMLIALLKHLNVDINAGPSTTTPTVTKNAPRDEGNWDAHFSFYQLYVDSF